MGNDKEEKKMAAPAKPIDNITVEMSEKDYKDFIENAISINKITYTPEQQKVIDRFKKFQQTQNRKR